MLQDIHRVTLKSYFVVECGPVECFIVIGQPHYYYFVHLQLFLCISLAKDKSISPNNQRSLASEIKMLVTFINH